MKLLLDMNLPPRWADWLSQRGHDVVHWSSIGARDATDATILAWAQAQGHVVVTRDLDFAAILAASGGSSPSVVQVRATSIASLEAERRVGDSIDAHRSALEAGAVLTIDLQRLRVRLLPLR